MKDAFVSKMESQLKESEASLDQLKHRAENKLHLEDWRTKKAAALAKLEQLRSDSGDRWNALRMGVESAWDELRAAFVTATARIPHEDSHETPKQPPGDRKAS